MVRIYLFILVEHNIKDYEFETVEKTNTKHFRQFRSIYRKDFFQQCTQTCTLVGQMSY